MFGKSLIEATNIKAVVSVLLTQFKQTSQKHFLSFQICICLKIQHRSCAVIIFDADWSRTKTPPLTVHIFECCQCVYKF